MKKPAIIASFLLLGGIAWGAPIPVNAPPITDPCSLSSALQVLIPGAQWTVQNNDYATFAFVGVSTFTAPTPTAVNTQIANCQAAQASASSTFQNNVATINTSTPTVLESAIIGVLQHKGLLTGP